MSMENRNENGVVKLVEHQALKLDELCSDSETSMFIKSCKIITLKRFQGKG